MAKLLESATSSNNEAQTLEPMQKFKLWPYLWVNLAKVGVLLVVLAVWEGLVDLLDFSPLVLPGPFRVLASLWENLSSGFF